MFCVDTTVKLFFGEDCQPFAYSTTLVYFNIVAVQQPRPMNALVVDSNVYEHLSTRYLMPQFTITEPISSTRQYEKTFIDSSATILRSRIITS